MITHYQAFMARVFLLDDDELRNYLNATCLIFDNKSICAEEAKALLAEYEAAHVTLTKDQLQEIYTEGYAEGWNEPRGADFAPGDRWRCSNIWENHQIEKENAK